MKSGMKKITAFNFVLMLLMALVMMSCNPLADTTKGASSLPSAPGSFHFLSSSTAPSQISFSWSKSSDAVFYEVKYGTQSGEHIYLSTCVASPCTISSLEENIRYYISVVAVNAVGGTVIDNELVVMLNSSNYSPVANAQVVAATYNSTTNITLTATDPESAPLTYHVLTYPIHGTLTGSGSSRVYTPDTDYYGADSFTFKVSDGVYDSDVKTISINVASPVMVYLSTYGTDFTAVVNDPTKPFKTAQAAYAAADAYQTAHSVPVILRVSAGTYTGITLTNDWNSNVKVVGDSAMTTFLGGINGNGVSGALYPTGISSGVANCVKVPGVTTPAGDDCYVISTRGRHMNLFGSKVNLGNISANHGIQNDFGVLDPEFLISPVIILNSGLTANDITSNNPGWMQLPGLVEIKSGATARDIYVNSIGASGAATDPINGGTVYVYGTVRNIEAKGKPNQIDGSGRGGIVHVYAGAVAGNIDVTGGGFAFSGALSNVPYNCVVGSPSGTNCQWSNTMGNGGTVNVEGSAGDIKADGGYIPLVSESFTNTLFYAGAGGTVTVSSGGTVGDISASASITSGRNRNTAGNIGGTIDVDGMAGDLAVNGSGGGVLAPDTGDYFVCGGATLGCLDVMASGSGGTVILRQGAIVGNIEAKGGSAQPYYVDSTADYSAYSGLGIDIDQIMNGGSIERYSAVTHGTITLTPGTDGNNVGSSGTITDH